MKLFDLINPVKIMAFFTLYGGGSGGGSSGSSTPDTRYANLDALYGTQNQASQFMLNNAMPHVPQITQNSAQMVGDAMDGTLARQMRDQAGNNAQMAYGSALDSNNRNMQRYGMGFNANRLLSENNRNAIMGAGMKAGEMNKANAAAEDMKWNRNANFYGQVMGMNNGAMQGMSQAGYGMANTANMQNQADQKNAAGYGQAGASFGAALFKADGGYIENAPKLADGGNAWEAYKAANPVKTATSSGGKYKGTNPYMAMLGGAAPSIAGAGLKDLFKGKDGSMYKLYNKWSADGKQQGVSEFDKGADSSAYSSTPTADVASGADYGAVTYGGDIGADGVGAYYDAGNTLDVGYGAGPTADVASGADYVNGASAAVEVAPAAVEGAGTGAELLSMALADGGAVRKQGLKLALGGMAKSTVANSSTTDNQSVARMDASQNMNLTRMGGQAPTNGQATHATPVRDTQYSGKTDGMGETSDGDPDGFGSHGGDNRHMAGKATMQVIGNWLGGQGGGMVGGALAEVLHPVGEGLSRGVIRAGDSLAGPGGALVLDPIGTTMSGKYSNQELAKGHLSVAMGMPWLSKFANGGRVDHTDGGKVSGPGTETSDDIPAWLSDGEFVLNAEAVKLIGKDKLSKWNKQGLKLRGKKEEADEGTPDATDSPAEEAKEMKRGLKVKAPKQFRPKKGLKLADGSEDPVEALLKKTSGTYGVRNSSAPSEVEEAPKVVAPPPPAQKKEPTLSERLRNFATGNLDKRMKDAGAYAKGGLVMKKRKGC